MRVLIAPDKFKGSLTAHEVGLAVQEGILQVYPTADCRVVPLADGGDGTTEILTRHAKGTLRTATVRDPLGRWITASFGISGDGSTAFIDMAGASGLVLLQPGERDPLRTSTVGTGDLIRTALDAGVSNICMGIGGSATNDGGMGAMTALGVRFYDAADQPLAGIGADLLRVERIDVAKLHPGLATANLTIFCDVDNPLYGESGAAAVFGPQKGATPDAVETLDAGLRQYESVLQRYGYTRTNFPGAGAGGGMPLSLAAFARSNIRSGIDFIMEYVGLESTIAWADLVVTGEGRIDRQTLSGKVVKGVGHLASKHNKPLWAVAGSSGVTDAEMRQLHIDRVIALVNADTSTAQAMAEAHALVRDRIAGLLRAEPFMPHQR